MLTESYRKQTASGGDIVEGETPPSTDVIRHTEALEQRRELLRKAGFERRLETEEHSGNTQSKIDFAAMVFDELTGRELRIWKNFLPTVTEPKRYNFDQVPEQALEEVVAVQEMDCFDRIEIWTPEGNGILGAASRIFDLALEHLDNLREKIDPMAVGVIVDASGNQHYYPIVRWGESLLPLQKIRTHVRRTKSTAWLIFAVLPTLIVLGGLAAYYNGIVAHGYAEMIAWTLIGVLGVFVLIFVAAVVIDVLDL